jgi:adenylate kinase
VASSVESASVIQLAKIVCVFGVSGVGKSTMLRRFVAQRPDWLHVIASDVLQQLAAEDTESLLTSESPTILENQFRLIEAINVVRLRDPNKKLLLDAHNVIDTGRALYQIPSNIIKNLSPDLIVCIWDDVKAIQQRSESAIDKIRPRRSLAQWAAYQKEVLETCKNYQSDLAIGCELIQSGDLDFLTKVLLT